jgi:hypothetical protein
VDDADDAKGRAGAVGRERRECRYSAWPKGAILTVRANGLSLAFVASAAATGAGSDANMANGRRGRA